MKTLDDANIIKLIDYLESKDNCYLVMKILKTKLKINIGKLKTKKANDKS